MSLFRQLKVSDTDYSVYSAIGPFACQLAAIAHRLSWERDDAKEGWVTVLPGLRVREEQE